MADHYLKQELYALIRRDAQSFDFLQQATLDGIWFWDVEHPEHEWMSDRFWTMMGYDPATRQPLAGEWQALIHLDDLKAVYQALERHFADPACPFDQIVRYTHRDGSTLWIRCRGLAIRDDQGRPIRMLGAHTDLTPVKAAQAELEVRTRDLARIARAMDSAQEGIIITDAQARILSVNRAFTQITGYSAREAVGNNPRLLKSGHHDADFYQAMWRGVINTGIWQGEIRNRRKNGEQYPQWTAISRVPGEDGENDYVAVFSDLTDKKRAEERIAFLAHYDPLTGLPNRHLLMDRLNQALAYNRRQGLYAAVITLDIDDFVAINERLGHQAGDGILRQIAARLQNDAREGDTISRLGGDEFVIVAQALPDPAQIHAITQKLRSCFIQPMTSEHGDIHLTAGMGIVFSSQGTDADTLLRHSHQAMYLAKQEGRGSCYIFDTAHAQEMDALRAQRQRIGLGVERGEFVLFYQPKVDLRSGWVRGVEALIRWRHPEQGVLSPAAFLPQIIDTDLEFQLGDWVLTEALRQMNEWKMSGTNISVSVNVSATHLLQAGFAHKLANMLLAYPQLAPGDLEIEILESAAVEDWEMAALAMQDCRALGVRFALDDFGTGYSSLVHLRRLALDTLKIDKGFVGDMLDDPEDFSIVESVVSLAISFQLEAIAEGVETERHARVLMKMGCPVVQGFGIARPMEAARVMPWMEEWKQSGLWKKMQQKPG
ncbi:putative bifunctional diguanylate cyclase/phosphodiesterase [Ectothiorhodospira lacustris]|uniref:putative bifunctional diguanylate cyclase/phosphodiesterase n=1 Tax=Ectothiorhodospira lacustris TaxID=2899127 RepID=UPI001EE9322D|nr:EAL domain-containing protein [Ectothiorhodospira lacustris]MCG5509813.1 EAL domain-containing protein [Ectothiorhodospira lacustris]MCG5522273.1 EAL domain-containing protein [Ectothiorhodospira lacustris]